MKLVRAIVISIFAFVSPFAFAGEVVQSLPDMPDKAARYVIYIHGAGPDLVGLMRAKEDVSRNTKELAARGFMVVAEVRPQGTIRKVPEDLDIYAKKIAEQVSSLLAAKVPPENISVVGYSRGGQIVQIVAGVVGRSDISYAILAGCFSDNGTAKQFVPLMADYAKKLKGRFISLVDEADPAFSSCSSYFARAVEKPVYIESILRTGRGHDLFNTPTDDWFKPLVDWISKL